MKVKELDILRDNHTDPRTAWRNTIIILVIFVVALALALIIRY